MSNIDDRNHAEHNDEDGPENNAEETENVDVEIQDTATNDDQQEAEYVEYNDQRDENEQNFSMYYMDDGGYNSIIEMCNDNPGGELEYSFSPKENVSTNANISESKTIAVDTDKNEIVISELSNQLSKKGGDNSCDIVTSVINDSSNQTSASNNDNNGEGDVITNNEVSGGMFNDESFFNHNNSQLDLYCSTDDNKIQSNQHTNNYPVHSPVEDSTRKLPTPFCQIKQKHLISSNESPVTEKGIPCSRKAITTSIDTSTPVNRKRQLSNIKTPCNLVNEAAKKVGPGCSIHPQTNEPITPMPDYSLFPTPDLKVEMKKYALRDIPKVKMIAKMKEVYKFQHNFTEWEEECKKPTRKTRKKTTKQDANKESGTEENPPKKKKRRQKEPIGNENPDSSKEPPLKEQLLNFMKSDGTLHCKILSYQPLEFTGLFESIKAKSITCSKKGLETFLDEQCICYFIATKDEPQKPRGRPRKEKKVKK